MPIVRSTERWASDVINSPVQKPPRHSLCALSRAQMISDSLTVPGSPYWLVSFFEFIPFYLLLIKFFC